MLTEFTIQPLQTHETTWLKHPVLSSEFGCCHKNVSCVCAWFFSPFSGDQTQLNRKMPSLQTSSTLWTPHTWCWQLSTATGIIKHPVIRTWICGSPRTRQTHFLYILLHLQSCLWRRSVVCVWCWLPCVYHLINTVHTSDTTNPKKHLYIYLLPHGKNILG